MHLWQQRDTKCICVMVISMRKIEKWRIQRSNIFNTTFNFKNIFTAVWKQVCIQTEKPKDIYIYNLRQWIPVVIFDCRFPCSLLKIKYFLWDILSMVRANFFLQLPLLDCQSLIINMKPLAYCHFDNIVQQHASHVTSNLKRQCDSYP